MYKFSIAQILNPNFYYNIMLDFYFNCISQMTKSKYSNIVLYYYVTMIRFS